jgi:ABC-2 type transport system ATP-binding protein
MQGQATTDQTEAVALPDASERRFTDRSPVAIEVRDVEKTFRIPENRITSFKEQAANPFGRGEYRDLKTLQGISLDVYRGEFFGIVGRNGSGKSTLLKIMASIYAADSGRIRIAGRLAPFIELGVGFDAELAARDNIILNGVMMGLSRRESERRIDSVLDFAELRDFENLKLKNYSSGMTVRLAFSVMVQSDADVLLVDEVLAVGDASFQQKCSDTFYAMRNAGKTIVLVTHDTAAVQSYCDRAMLIHDGVTQYLGDPEEVGRRYLQLNFATAGEGIPENVGLRAADVHARVRDAWLEDENGDRQDNVDGRQPIRVNAVIEARERLENVVVAFHLYDVRGVHILGFNYSRRDAGEAAPEVLEEGGRLRVSVELENRLAKGHYFLKCWVARGEGPADLKVQVFDLLDFVVYNVEPIAGLIDVDPVVSSEMLN